MRTVAFSLLTLAFTTAISIAGEMTTTGVLKQAKDKETKAVYFLIETEKPVTKGSEKTSKLQIAGLDQEAWSNAAKLIGKKVTEKGNVGEPETRYYFTDLLIVTDKVEVVK